MTALANPPAGAFTDWSLVQRMEALQRANEIRSQRAQLKRDLKAGWTPIAIAELLLEPPEYLETAKVYDLLLAMPKVGRVRVNKWLRNAGVSPSKTLSGLTARQRRELIALMPAVMRTRVGS